MKGVFFFLFFLLVGVQNIQLEITQSDSSKNFLTLNAPIFLRFNTSFTSIVGQVIFENDVEKREGKILVVESSTFNAELINKWVDLVPPALAYLFVATAMYDYAGMANIMYYYGTHYNNNTIIGGLSRSDYVLLLGHIDNESVIVANYTSNDSNYFKEKFLGYWKYQILLCAISVILIVLCIYYIFVLKKSGKLKLNLISFILVEVTVTNVYQFIFNAIDPDYVYGIIESRVAIPLNNISWPITMFNILLIAINWEMLLQKITRSNVSQLKSRLIYIIIYSGILIIHLVLIFALPFVDANHYVPVMTSLQIVNIVPILASFIYCVINSIRIKPLKDMLQEKKKRKNEESNILYLYRQCRTINLFNWKNSSYLSLLLDLEIKLQRTRLLIQINRRSHLQSRRHLLL